VGPSCTRTCEEVGPSRAGGAPSIPRTFDGGGDCELFDAFPAGGRWPAASAGAGPLRAAARALSEMEAALRLPSLRRRRFHHLARKGDGPAGQALPGQIGAPHTSEPHGRIRPGPVRMSGLLAPAGSACPSPCRSRPSVWAAVYQGDYADPGTRGIQGLHAAAGRLGSRGVPPAGLRRIGPNGEKKPGGLSAPGIARRLAARGKDGRRPTARPCRASKRLGSTADTSRVWFGPPHRAAASLGHRGRTGGRSAPTGFA